MAIAVSSPSRAGSENALQATSWRARYSRTPKGGALAKATHREPESGARRSDRGRIGLPRGKHDKPERLVEGGRDRFVRKRKGRSLRLLGLQPNGTAAGSWEWSPFSKCEDAGRRKELTNDRILWPPRAGRRSEKLCWLRADCQATAQESPGAAQRAPGLGKRQRSQVAGRRSQPGSANAGSGVSWRRRSGVLLSIEAAWVCEALHVGTNS